MEEVAVIMMAPCVVFNGFYCKNIAYLHLGASFAVFLSRIVG